MNRLKRFFLLLFVIVCALPTSAQDGDPLFTLHSDDPVVSHGENDDWDNRYTDPGAVMYHDGLFHMFRNGFQAWPASVQVGYLTSPDGLTWTEVTEDPVLTTDEVPYAGLAALASSALVEEDGTWVLYFYTWEPGASTQTTAGRIGRATAATPEGPWTPDPDPVLSPGSAGEWDDLQIDAPRVLRTEDGYVMYYSATDSEGYWNHAIGMATSPDGVTWTKYDDPTTTDAPFAESDPILVAGDGERIVHQPLVTNTPEGGWMMIYRSVIAPGNMALGLATSADGVHWERVPGDFFWTRSTIPRSMGFWYTALAHHDDTYYLYIEGGRGSNTDIYAATHEGALTE